MARRMTHRMTQRTIPRKRKIDASKNERAEKKQIANEGSDGIEITTSIKTKRMKRIRIRAKKKAKIPKMKSRTKINQTLGTVKNEAQH